MRSKTYLSRQDFQCGVMKDSEDLSCHSIAYLSSVLNVCSSKTILLYLHIRNTGRNKYGEVKPVLKCVLRSQILKFQ